MARDRIVNVGIVQTTCSKDLEDNMRKAVKGIEEAAAKGAQIVCLQELFRSTYFCDVEDYDNFNLAEEIPGPTTEFFSKLAKKHNIVIVASLFEKRAQGLYHNTAAVIDADGSYLGKYRKMHIPDDPGYYEKFYFTPGDLGFKVFETRYAKVGVLVCWDQWYPEAARITSLMGAEMLFYPTAIGWHKDQDEQTNQEQHNAWQTIQQSHAVANGVPVIGVNRTGVEGDMQFWGGSFVTNAFGWLEYKAPHLEETVQVVPVDMNKSDSYRVHWPFLRDRRIDAYSPIEKRFIDE
ncbi:MAG: carbon-nitrogen hydrolase [Cyclobacteriaceae bacterium]|nr:carbon-nitrogen hydrolase [Cyclobacteriaceae bacterium]